MMKVLITGSNGFIGKNLLVRLRESEQFQVSLYDRSCGESALRDLVCDSEFIFHLAGVNRPANVADFAANADLSRKLTALITETGRHIPVVFTSSTQARLENPYGRSKREAEDALLACAAATNSQVYIYRLPNVFGKWCRPNYNSAVATFCHNIARDLPVTINDPSASLFLLHIDDLVEDFSWVLQRHCTGEETQELPSYREIAPIHKTTVGELVDKIRSFRESRSSLTVDHVGTGFLRALYSTYLSYLPATAFAYPIRKNVDSRGEFAEMLKTLDSGQFSYLTAHPGVTRGGHYHNTKSEKFLVIRGRARFRFRHILGGETAEVETSGDKPQIVETIPGWSHDITNVGQSELIVMLWASEVFDRARPDTFPWKVLT
jgi:UDP-2-acetamido-2,6-beta-L-arabino-hexul-4-ose reductase